MGIERAVTRWYLQRQAYENEVATLEVRLGEMRTNGQESESKERSEVAKQLVDTRARLLTLGPCPKPMMG
jgi:hypothetical protein